MTKCSLDEASLALLLMSIVMRAGGRIVVRQGDIAQLVDGTRLTVCDSGDDLVVTAGRRGEHPAGHA